MDLKQAGQGLHVAAASRVYIVSPIWDSAVESQAVKRAHRIGQGREVFVETLVLGGTIEEAMVRRREESNKVDDGDEIASAEIEDVAEKEMKTKGKRNSVNTTGHPILEDSGMVKVLKDVEFLTHHDGEEKFASLEKPISLFKSFEAQKETVDDSVQELESDLVQSQPAPGIVPGPLIASRLRYSHSDYPTEVRFNRPTLTPLGPPRRSIFGTQNPNLPSLDTGVKSPEKRKASSTPLDIAILANEVGSSGGQENGGDKPDRRREPSPVKRVKLGRRYG